MTTSARQRATARWTSARRQRTRARLRQECERIGARLRTPSYRATMVEAIGEAEVDAIERANAAMLEELV